MRHAKAFSLTEVVVVCAILCVLAAFTYPVFSSAKKASNEAQCVSNLRQLYVAIELYRQEWQGDRESGTPSQMGLPPGLGTLDIRSTLDCAGIDPYHCTTLAPGGGLYANWPSGIPQFQSDWKDKAWADYVTRFEGESVLVFDNNHQLACPVTEFSTGRAIGVRLNGSVKTQVKFGDPSHPSRMWWH